MLVSGFALSNDAVDPSSELRAQRKGSLAQSSSAFGFARPSVRLSVCPAGDVVCSLALSHMGRVIRL